MLFIMEWTGSKKRLVFFLRGSLMASYVSTLCEQMAKRKEQETQAALPGSCESDYALILLNDSNVNSPTGVITLNR